MVGSKRGPQVFPRTPLEGSEHCQPQLRPGGSSSHSTPSRVQSGLRPSLEKLKYVPSEYPERAVSFTEWLVRRASIQSMELCEKQGLWGRGHSNLGGRVWEEEVVVDVSRPELPLEASGKQPTLTHLPAIKAASCSHIERLLCARHFVGCRRSTRI